MNKNTLQIKEWLEIKSKSNKVITLDTDLLEDGILDSLQFMNLLLLLEEVTNTEIDMSTISMDVFRTLNSIEKEFFS